MEDAYGYLEQRKLSRFCRTVEKPERIPLFYNAAMALINSYVDKPYASGIHHADTSTHPNGVTSSGNGDVATNGSINSVVTAPVTLLRSIVCSSLMQVSDIYTAQAPW